MTDPKYRLVGAVEDRVMEECSELIQAICKARRFGLENYHPRDSEKVSNRQLILNEIDDVRRVTLELLESLEND